MSEIEKIKNIYKKRQSKASVYDRLGKNFYYILFSEFERELLLTKIIKEKFGTVHASKILEVGAGYGNNILFLKRVGFSWSSITANELLTDRFSVLAQNFHMINLIHGDFLDTNVNEKYDIVYQSMVFSSILDNEMKSKFANKMWNALNENGIILWYDFKFDNPYNKDVKGIKKREVLELFPNSSNIRFYNITLAPPVGRVIGKFYNIVNFLFPFLRTHYVAVITK